jgi:enamine deaminase RidA (YjgF/YER057c/UK114 family)
VLKAAGSSWDKVVKVNVYLKSMNDYAIMNEEYIRVCHIHLNLLELSHQQHSQLLPVPKPARTCIQAGGLPYDVDIEIEAIAAA